MQTAQVWNLSQHSFGIYNLARYTVVCCVAQENRVCKYNVSILTRRTKYNFISIHSSVISCVNQTKFAVRIPAFRVDSSILRQPFLRYEPSKSHSFFSVFLLCFLSFLLFPHLQKNCQKIYKM